MIFWPTTTLWISIYAKPLEQPGTCPGRVRWDLNSDPMAVLDQYCSVKGVKGLSVVDASVMPRVTRSGGSHATVVMIGERVVDWIASA